MFGKKPQDNKTYALTLTSSEVQMLGTICSGVAESALMDSHQAKHDKNTREAMADAFLTAGLLLNKIHAELRPDEPRPDDEVFHSTAAAIRSGWEKGAVEKANDLWENQSPEFREKVEKAAADPDLQEKVAARMGATGQGGQWGL